MLKKWLSEPLLHFLLIGAVLFLAYGLKNDAISDESPDRIEINDTQINLLRARWEKKWQRPPTATELKGMIEQSIREEVLYREALALGMDRNDPVVRRRMAQKFEFISSDLVAQVEPEETQLKTYFEKHAEKFEQAGQISFIQIYLNADRRGAQLEHDANTLLNTLRESESTLQPEALGDPFMFGQVFRDQDEFAIARVFGQDFSDALFKLPTNSWLGPVRSGLGYHIVRIDSKTDSLLPEFETVREKVRSEWMDETRRKMDEALYLRMRDKYQVVLPETYSSS